MAKGGTGRKVVDVEIPAVGLRVKQTAEEVELYILTVDGKSIAAQLGVRRMRWHGGKFQAEGFQRALDMTRVKEIATYLSSNPPHMPNAIVIALEKGAIEFDPLPNQEDLVTQFGKVVIHGKLTEENGKKVPLPENERIGYVIDGQHRLRGIEESTLQPGTFPVLLSAFHDVSTQFQLTQFYALNQTVPINPSQLALLRRELGIALSPKEARKRAISTVLQYLQEKPNSPFLPEKHVKSAVYKGQLDITVVERMIDRAVKNTDLKFRWRPNAEEIPEADLRAIADGLYVFWRAVGETFPQYWGKRPAQQRLFSAIGLYTLIQFYDRVMKDIDVNSSVAVKEVRERLAIIADLPWNKMLGLPATPKSVYPDLLFHALKELWEAKGARPHQFRIVNPESGLPDVDLVLTGG